MAHEKTNVPSPVRAAGIIALAESAVVLCYSVFLITRDVLGYRDPSAVFAEQAAGRAALLGVGTAIMLIVLFGGVAFAARNLTQGGRWGRGPVFMTQILLLPVSYYIAMAGQWPFAIPVAVVALAGLGCLVHPLSIEWARTHYGPAPRS